MEDTMPSVLMEIKQEKQKEVDALYEKKLADMYKGDAVPRGQGRLSFFDAITAPRKYKAPNMIAEFKRTSPSNKRKGNPPYNHHATPRGHARIYELYGTSAMSVLTDKHFDGSIGDLIQARQVTRLPILRKDFTIDPAQIYEARYHRADAVLLIAAMLSVEEMEEMIKVADLLRMDCLVESHNEGELEKAIAAGTKIFGINNRDLHHKDLPTDISTTLNLLDKVPEGAPIVTESGIHNYDDVKMLSDPRISAMLIGTSIMKARSPADKIYELQGRY